MNEIVLYILLILISLGGGFIQRVSGFGYGIFIMLFLPYLLPDYTMGASISCMVSAIGAGYNAFRHRKDIRFRIILPLLGAAAVAIPIAVYFSSAAPQSLMKRIFGVILVLLSIYFLFFSKRIRIKPTVTNGILAGTLGGALNGLFSTGGPPVVLFMIHAAPNNLVYFATMQFYASVTNLYSTAARFANGIITREVMAYFALSLVGWAAGNYLGTKVFNRLDGETLKRVIYIGMIISGILMIVKG